MPCTLSSLIAVSASASNAFGLPIGRSVCAIFGVICLLIAILYPPEYPALRKYGRKAWRVTKSTVDKSENAASRFLRAVLGSVDRALTWAYGDELLSLQVAAVFFCTAIASFGVSIGLSETGAFHGWIFHYHGTSYINSVAYPYTIDVSLVPFLGAIGMSPESVPLFFGTCVFFLLLGLVPGVLKTIQEGRRQRSPQYTFSGVCLLLVLTSFLFFNHMAHAYKPWPQFGRQFMVAGFVAMAFVVAFAGLLLFLWLSRILLRFSQSKRSVLGLLVGLLYMPLSALLLLPAWSYWVTFWLQENWKNSIFVYPANHFYHYKYFEWAMSLSSEMNVNTASLSLLVILISAFLLLLKLAAFIVPRSVYVASDAFIEANRGKFATVGLTLLAIAFPYYGDLLTWVRDLHK